MKVALIYFTFYKDADLLRQSFRSVERIRNMRNEHTFDVFVFDDDAHPLSVVPEGVTYQRTTFNRQGNLNGFECVLGMLECYKAVASLGYDWICKVDCDTYINEADWFLETDFERVASVGSYNHLDFSHGCMYCLTAHGVERIARLLERKDISERVSKARCEDRIFSALAHCTGLNCVHLTNVYNTLGRPRTCYHDFDWLGYTSAVKNPDKALLAMHTAVVFKVNSHWRTPEQRDADRTDALVRMRAYADWLDARADVSV